MILEGGQGAGNQVENLYSVRRQRKKRKEEKEEDEEGAEERALLGVSCR
jgi:hypothetical protein